MAAPGTRPRVRPRVRAAATPANTNLPDRLPATALLALRLATADLAIVATDAPSARSSLRLSTHPNRILKTRQPRQDLEVRLPLDQRRPLLHAKGMRGQRTILSQESAADSIPRRQSFRICAITKLRGLRREPALTIRRQAAEIDLLYLKMLEACRESLRPVALVASCLIRDATIRSNLLRSREAKSMLAPRLALLLLAFLQRPPLSPRF